MDLTSLSSNLPRNNSNLSNPSGADHSDSPHDPYESEDLSALLYSAFKHTATSVTTLHQTAQRQLERSRKAGYAEGYDSCLSDLISLLGRVEQRSDPKTTELVRQWALAKRRKNGSAARQHQNHHQHREHREDSMESDAMTDAPVVPSSPPPVETLPTPPAPIVQHHTPAPETTRQTMPTPPQAVLPPQIPSFTFQPSHHFPQLPETADVDLPDTDGDFASPPGSPNRIPGPNIFHFNNPAPPFRSGNHPRPKDKWGHNRHAHGVVGHDGLDRSRTGGKRRFSNMSDFFDLAALEKQMERKKGRYQ